VFLHLADPQAAMSELQGVLRPAAVVHREYDSVLTFKDPDGIQFEMVSAGCEPLRDLAHLLDELAEVATLEDHGVGTDGVRPG
jgi:hypothetical protein